MSEPTMDGAPPTYPDFYSEISKLYARLEELHYIDGVLDAIDSPEQNWDRIKEAGLSGHISQRWMHVGSTHPVKCLVPKAITPDIEASLKASAQASAQAWATANRGALLTSMDPWICSRAEDYQIAYDGLESACFSVRRVPNNFTGLGETLAHWSGDAANNFNNWFCVATDTVRRNQLYAMNAAQSAVVAGEGISNMAKHHLMNALVAANDCALAQLEARARDDRGPSAVQFLGMASLTVDLLSIFSFPAPLASGAFSLVSTSLGFAASQIPSQAGQKLPIAAKSAPEIDGKVFDQVAHVETTAGGYYAELETQVRAIASNIDGFVQDHLWFTRKPWLAEDASADEFYHGTSSRDV